MIDDSFEVLVDINQLVMHDFKLFLWLVVVWHLTLRVGRIFFAFAAMLNQSIDFCLYFITAKC